MNATAFEPFFSFDKNMKQVAESSKITNQKKAGIDFFVAFIFILYFCADLFRIAYTYVVGSTRYFYTGYNIVFIACIALYALLRSRRNLTPAVVCFMVIAVIFGVTYLFHPEYKSWYFEQTYGIQIQFFRCTGGIWAFWVISMVPDRETLLRYLRIASFLIFITQLYLFVLAQRRGYWISYDSQYNRVESSYNLGFGYEMLFSLLFFAGEMVLNRKKYYFPLVVVSAVLILLGGSRGPLIWMILIFPAMLLYRWKSASQRSRVFIVAVFVILLPVALMIFLYFEDILLVLQNVLEGLGFSSKTLLRILSDDATDLSGRDEIYAAVWDLIKTGGPFGRGAFGERTTVGQLVRWGYAHNIFLEVYCAFGYVGGTIVFAVLITQILKTAVHCKQPYEQIVFLTFLFSSMKLMFSDSFWFNSSFWALLAILWMWRKQDVKSDVRNPMRFLRAA